MGPYKNYFGRHQTLAQKKFNKAITKLQIKVKHGFAIHQNLWTWNGFYLGLKISKKAVAEHAILVLILNIWTCMRGNQTSYWFAYTPLLVIEYLQLLAININDITKNEVKNIKATNAKDEHRKKLIESKLEAKDNDDK